MGMTLGFLGMRHEYLRRAPHASSFFAKQKNECLLVGRCISLRCVMPKKRSAGRPETVESDSAPTIYERLFRINEAFDTVAVNLRLLGQHRWLKANQIRRFEELTAEARAAANSYLLEAFATQEAAEAGRMFRIRLARERKEDQG